MSIQTIEDYTQGVTQRQFNANRLLQDGQDGVVCRLGIIGEAAGRLQKDLTDRYSDIPWRRTAGMRNRLTHEYIGVLLERVWEVIERDLPALKVNICKMVEDLS